MGKLRPERRDFPRLHSKFETKLLKTISRVRNYLPGTIWEYLLKDVFLHGFLTLLRVKKFVYVHVWGGVYAYIYIYMIFKISYTHTHTE